MPTPESPRTLMIEGQLRPNKITDPRVLKAFGSVVREDFVPAALKGAAYVDGPLALGRGRFMLEPTILARMIQEADIAPRDRVLDIGCGNGYAAAILAQLAAAVVAVDAEPEFIRTAGVNLGDLSNVKLFAAPGPGGYPALAPYDVILIEGAVTSLPDALKAQLAGHGRLICAISPGPGAAGEIVLFERIGDVLSRRPVCNAWLKFLPGFFDKQEFAL